MDMGQVKQGGLEVRRTENCAARDEILMKSKMYILQRLICKIEDLGSLVLSEGLGEAMLVEKL